jgi:hypothetical protein
MKENFFSRTYVRNRVLERYVSDNLAGSVNCFAIICLRRLGSFVSHHKADIQDREGGAFCYSFFKGAPIQHAGEFSLVNPCVVG